MQVLSLISLSTLALAPSLHLRPTVAGPFLRLHRPIVSSLMDDAPSVEAQHPEELFGGWEVRCTLSGMEELWVELDAAGALSCSSKVGTGQTWTAERSGQGWALSMTLLDKLKRPLLFQGRVSSDEYRSHQLKGRVIGQPKRATSAAQFRAGTQVGEFSGYKLD